MSKVLSKAQVKAIKTQLITREQRKAKGQKVKTFADIAEKFKTAVATIVWIADGKCHADVKVKGFDALVKARQKRLNNRKSKVVKLKKKTSKKIKLHTRKPKKVLLAGAPKRADYSDWLAKMSKEKKLIKKALMLLEQMEATPKKRGRFRKEEVTATEAPKKRGRPRKVTAEAPKKRGRPKKAKRGRPRKTTAAEAPKKRGRPRKITTKRGRPSKVALMSLEFVEAPKKRGRPRKTTAAEAPKKRGRPRKTTAATTGEAPKKRGRPKKVVTASPDVAAVVPAPIAPVINDTSVVVPPPALVAEVVAETTIEQPQA